MWTYLLRRVLLMIPALGVMMVISFVLSRASPGDPVLMQMGGREEVTRIGDRKSRDEEYARISKEMGLDLPTFYVEFGAMSYPDTLHKIVHLPTREAMAELAFRHGNWPAVDAYLRSMQNFLDQSYSHQQPIGRNEELNEVRTTARLLTQTAQEQEIDYQLARLDSILDLDTNLRSLAPPLETLKSSRKKLLTSRQPWKSYIPTLRFHGFDNQFHHWFVRFIQFDWGKSYQSRRSVKQEVMAALPWSLLLGATAYLISFLVALGIGLYAIRNLGGRGDRWSTLVVFGLHSIPSFVVSMLAITFLCNPEYFHWFPVSGLRSDGSESWPWTYRLLDLLHHLTLPTLVFALHGIAVLSRQTRGSLLNNMSMDYIRTARAKGLSEKGLIAQHALPNSLPPLIHHVSQHIPGILMGSVFIETVFSLPGMGNLVVEALHTGDHPVVVGVFALVGLATLFANLLADVLYAFTDPRVELQSTR
jgi:peptide/nickel transport system permease protein